MPRKMPKSSDSHIYDREAISHLERLLPKHWKMMPMRDMYSGIEYGEDLLIKITDESNRLTGAEFCVQNKATGKKLGKRRIGFPIEVTTLNYLSSLSRPVLLHFYHKPSNTGYWSWLDEHDATEWQGKKEVTLSISLKNVLDSQAVKSIEEYVLRHHYMHSLMDGAARSSRTDPNFDWIFAQEGKDITISAKPKHDQAHTLIRLAQNAGTETYQKLKEAVEKGESIHIPANQLHFDGLPTWLEVLFNRGDWDVLMIPDIPDERLILKWVFLDSNDTPLFNTGFFQLKLTKEGTLFRRWEAEAPGIPIVYSIDVDYPSETLSVSLTGKLPIQDPIQYSAYMEIFATLQQATKITITTHQEHSFTTELGEPLVPAFSREDEATRRLASALATIATKLKVSIPVPDGFTGKELSMAEALAKILRTGISTEPIQLSDEAYLYTKTTVGDLKHLSPSPCLDDHIDVRIPGPSRFADLFGYRLELGPTELEFLNSRLRDKDTACQRIETDDLTTEITIILDIDHENSRTRFLNWSP
jgi:hypothetical protein